MADIQTSSESGRRRGGQRGKKLSTRVDMTPMVDLGFLLITFFMLTTTMAKSRSLLLVMPADGPSTPVSASKSMTLLVHGDNGISWYDGQGDDPANPPELHASSFAASGGIGDIIRAKRQKVAQAHGDPEKLVVLIKAAADASYGGVVEALDEMKINRVSRYALVDITPGEQVLLGR
ncbi:ExbD/TolR family protein [Chitinophaga lutea]